MTLSNKKLVPEKPESIRLNGARKIVTPIALMTPARVSIKTLRNSKVLKKLAMDAKNLLGFFVFAVFLVAFVFFIFIVYQNNTKL